MPLTKFPAKKTQTNTNTTNKCNERKWAFAALKWSQHSQTVVSRNILYCFVFSHDLIIRCQCTHTHSPRSPHQPFIILLISKAKPNALKFRKLNKQLVRKCYTTIRLSTNKIENWENKRAKRKKKTVHVCNVVHVVWGNYPTIFSSLVFIWFRLWIYLYKFLWCARHIFIWKIIMI